MVSCRCIVPILSLGKEAREKIRCVAGVRYGFKHMCNVTEMLAVPSIVELKAANVEAARTGSIVLVNKGECVLLIVKPDAFSFHVHGPWPRRQNAVLGPTSFCSGYGAQYIKGNTSFVRNDPRHVIAGVGIVNIRVGSG